MSSYKKCGISTKNKIISAEERKKKFTLKNPNQINIIKVQVDGCLITNGQRCDYLFDIMATKTIYYVELKGKDVEKAAKQLKATIKFCSTMHKGLNKMCYIVSSRVPLQGPKVQVLKRQFQKETGVSLRISCKQKTVRI